jgi:hypothetical protein
MKIVTIITFAVLCGSILSQGADCTVGCAECQASGCKKCYDAPLFNNGEQCGNPDVDVSGLNCMVYAFGS